jgi:hypothetical protein
MFIVRRGCSRSHRRATRVHRFIRCVALVLTAMLACAALPSSADAQFGKLMKKVGKKVAGRPDAPASAASVPAPTFTANVLEITDARLGQLLKGLDAERAARPALRQQDAAAQAAYEAAQKDYGEKRSAYERDLAAYQRKFDAYDNCTRQVEAKYEKEAAGDESLEEKEQARTATEAAMEGQAQRMQALVDRMQAANARGDEKTARALADSLHALAAMTVARGAAGVQEARASDARDQRREADRATCGDPGKPPVEPAPPSEIHSSVSAALERAGVQASGLTATQYAIMRERVAAYVNVNGEFRSGNQYAFSEDELEVLRQHAEELTARGQDLAPYGAWRFAPKGP